MIVTRGMGATGVLTTWGMGYNGYAQEAVQPTGGWVRKKVRREEEISVPRRDDDEDLFRTLLAFIEVLNETNLD